MQEKNYVYVEPNKKFDLDAIIVQFNDGICFRKNTSELKQINRN